MLTRVSIWQTSLYVPTVPPSSDEGCQRRTAEGLFLSAAHAECGSGNEDIAKIAKKITSDTYGERVVFCLPKKFIYIEKVAFEYSAVCELKNLVVDDELLKDEYEIYIEERLWQS